MVFSPDELAQDAAPAVTQGEYAQAQAQVSNPNPNSGGPDGVDTAPLVASWRPLFRHDCTFDATIFTDVLLNLIKNPNINSSWLFRADILHDETPGLQSTDTDVDTAPATATPTEPGTIPEVPSFVGFECRRHMVRRLIPRNTLRDKPLDQTCLFYGNLTAPQGGHDEADAGASRHEKIKTLVVYLPHVVSEDDMPFYHPKVRGIAFLHEWDPTESGPAESRGSISISYVYFDASGRSNDRLTRTAFHLLEVIYKHGQGRVEGYQKRVHHDVLVPQARVQNTYTTLKQKYARTLIEKWAEVTDPEKHVFEDLLIASFLIELWADMYNPSSIPFPGFVDIGCGNGLLVYILNLEGFRGWGFDARARKSWAGYNTRLCFPDGSQEQDSLQQLLLLPSPVSRVGLAEVSSEDFHEDMVHDGRFPKGTFIISNHADELTPWTPIIATISECPFIMIPCCSHDLTGKRFRAPPPKQEKTDDKSKSKRNKKQSESAYNSLVHWVAQIGRDCGWDIEQEMLRIPSTRNTGLIGRKRASEASTVDIQAIVDRYGGTAGYLETVIKLAKKSASASEDKH